MKSKVDIFRPLAAAKRGCRADSATSIFRRNNNNNQKKIHRGTNSKISKGDNADDDDDDDDDEESIVVVSTPPGEWPPHKATLSSTASELTNSPHKPLKTSAPLPFSADSANDAVVSSGNNDGNCCTSSSPRTSTATATMTTTTMSTTQVASPSYYRIELDPENDNMVQLTAGDDSSVQFTPEVHNRQLQMAIEDDRNKGIIRASPVVERKEMPIEATPSQHSSQRRHHEIMHQQQQQQPQQRWTVSGNGKIIAIPPSPSHVSMTHDYVHKKGKGGDNENDDLSLPPMLVKANSHGDSSSQSSADDMIDNNSYISSNSLRNDRNLESPPRMTRSIVSQSLFQDSIGSSSREGSQGSRRSRTGRKNAAGSSSDGDAEKCNAGGCGTRLPSFDFFGTLLDVFSLNGACCRQAKSASCAGAAGAPSDIVLCR